MHINIISLISFICDRYCPRKLIAMWCICLITKCTCEIIIDQCETEMMIFSIGLVHDDGNSYFGNWGRMYVVCFSFSISFSMRTAVLPSTTWCCCKAFLGGTVRKVSDSYNLTSLTVDEQLEMATMTLEVPPRGVSCKSSCTTRVSSIVQSCYLNY